jgi:hypothetical protein
MAMGCRLMRVCAMAGSLLAAGPTLAEGDWKGDLQIYGWIPQNDIKLNNGFEYEISRQDILEDIDIFLMTTGRLRRDRWSFALDLVYGDISDKDFDEELLLEGLVTLDKGGLEIWIVTPNIGYMVLDNEQQRFEVYAGARYFSLEVDVRLETESILPGRPPKVVESSDSVDHWDAIVGVRGLYYLSDRWYIPYSVNAGAGDSDFTWTAWGGVGYRFTGVDALFGWRYMTYDVGDDTPIEELDISGPFVGAMFRW